MMTVLHSNLAMCCLKLNEFDNSINSARSALKYDGKHEKSLYRLGTALDQKGETKQALEALDELLEINPEFADGASWRETLLTKLHPDGCHQGFTKCFDF